MPDEQNRLLLLSSDLRRRYAEDILTALALPPGSMIQFRYGADYVVAALQRSVADGTVLGGRALLGFVAGVDSDSPFVVPVRFARVMSAACVADVFIFKLRIESYVDLDQYPRSHEDIAGASRTFLEQLVGTNGKYYPAVATFPDLHVSEATDAPQQWLGAALRLSLHDTFKDSYFLRVDTPVTQRGKQLKFSEDGRLEVLDQQSVRVSASFYSTRYEPLAKPVLTCDTDGTFIRVSSDAQYEVALRYDSVEFWLHPAALDFDTLSRVTISLAGHADDCELLPANARFQVAVRRSRPRLAARVSITAIGALLVALPAIVGTSTPIQLRIIAALLGAGLLAVASIVLTASN